MSGFRDKGSRRLSKYLKFLNLGIFWILECGQAWFTCCRVNISERVCHEHCKTLNWRIVLIVIKNVSYSCWTCAWNVICTAVLCDFVVGTTILLYYTTIYYYTTVLYYYILLYYRTILLYTIILLYYTSIIILLYYTTIIVLLYYRTILVYDKHCCDMDATGVMCNRA